MRNKGSGIKKAMVFIAVMSAVIACIMAVPRTITGYAECW